MNGVVMGWQLGCCQIGPLGSKHLPLIVETGAWTLAKANGYPATKIRQLKCGATITAISRAQ